MADVSGWEVLRDAVMLQVHHTDLATVPPNTLDGLVLTGPAPIADLRKRKLAGDRVLLVDRERYRREAATAEADVAADLTDLDLAVRKHATAVLTPTGLIAAGDVATLQSTLDAFERRRDESSVLTLPLGAGWLRAEWRPMLLKLLIAADGPKALVLQESGDPFGRARSVPILADLARAVPDLGVVRTDLAGFGAVALGAAFTAIGLRANQRHIPAPVGPPRRRNGVVEPPGVPVLVPAFLSFHGGRRLAMRLDPDSEAARCPCYACRPGLPLTRFVGAQAKQATAHNLAVLEMLTEELAQRPAGPPRIRWWLASCAEAHARLREFNATQVPGLRLDEPAQLRQWAELKPG